MRDALTNADPGDETLFDPATTVLPKCRACNTTRTGLCRFDADVAHQLIPASSTRPRSCLNRVDPQTMAIPY
jgi:hypothetical protein